MRFSFLLIGILLTDWCGAQPFFPNSFSGRYYPGHQSPFATLDTSASTRGTKKWSLQTYSSLSAGMMFWKGGSTSYISAPLGLQLTRMFSNNVFAFAGVSVAPSLVGVRSAFRNAKTGLQGMNPSYQFGAFSRAELGLGYVNDARTFSITGSIGVQRSDFPFAPGIRPVGNHTQQMHGF